MLKIKRILCPIDFSEASLKGLQEAVRYAVAFNAELHLVHIAYNGIPLAGDAVGYLAVPPEVYEMPRRNAEQKLREMADELNERGVRTSYTVGTGEAGLEIVRLAADMQIDLIVLATHGWTGWKRILFGSVAEKVVRYARCRVLTVPVRRQVVRRIREKPLSLAPAPKRKRLAAAA